MIQVVRSIPVYYEEYGSGIPLLIIHALPSDHQVMKAVFEPVCEKRPGWRRIYIDLPGMGKTPGGGWINNHDDMFVVVSEFMRAVAPGQRYVVAGYSYGGMLAQALAYWEGAQLDGLFLINSAMPNTQSSPNLPRPQVLAPNTKFQAALTPGDNLLKGLFVVQDYDLLQLARTYGGPGFTTADYPFLNKLLKRVDFSFPVQQPRQPLAAPVLIVTGRQDSVVGYRDQLAILENYPRATFAIIDRAGHLLPIEQGDIFSTLLNEWLNRVEEFTTRR